jgi:ABC-type Zn uptake system ZnuABC Zn-binding protein ZnuA
MEENLDLTKRYWWGIGVLLVILLSVVLYSRSVPDTVTEPKKLDVVVTTSHLQCAVKDIGGSRVRVTVLVSPSSCPGHHDIKPKDIAILERSTLLLSHGYEEFMPNLLKSLGKRAPESVVVGLEGNWLVPDVYLRAAEQVAHVLQEEDPVNVDYYGASLTSLRTVTTELEEQLLSELVSSGVSEAAVLCSEQQKQLLKWMGLRVVGTYPRAEEATPPMLHRLAVLGKEEKVRLVVDNLQSGPAAGKQLARDIGAAHVTLSNFPGGFSGTDTWQNCLEDNVKRLIQALSEDRK